MPEIHIYIDPTGQHVQVQPEGFAGPTCHQASAPFLEAFGGTILAHTSTAEALIQSDATIHHQQQGFAS